MTKKGFLVKVIAKKTPQTVTVTRDYFRRHPKYQKMIRQTTKLLAHNQLPDVKVGDTVVVVPSRPFSKRKHFEVIEIIKSL